MTMCYMSPTLGNVIRIFLVNSNIRYCSWSGYKDDVPIACITNHLDFSKSQKLVDSYYIRNN